jgi:DNA-binding response OmpR family regulator
MASSPHIDLRTTKVMVVDDNAQSLDLMAQILVGFRVKQIATCRTPEEAWIKVSKERFDLILLDLEMPGEDGLTVTRRIRREADHPNVTAPVIILSAHTPIERVHEARDAGANLVVKKPIAPAVLLARIAWLARTPRNFVTSTQYCGPDRRFRREPPPEDTGERRADALALTAAPERAMSQDEIDALFG